MTLEAGQKLAHYEILEPIGKGGMGEVYRARDTKLGREVAIKVLPDAFAEDRERLARFEREARLLASLNHPNIATLHGLEESGGIRFLVMELVPGETLAERIAAGPLPVDEALPLFMEIADGLSAAHEKGVIHRDLKPANIMVTPEGKPKILDFGLAKEYGKETSVSNLSESPTRLRQGFGETGPVRQGFGEASRASKGTATGVIMGTAAYMSPEQARGKPVDKRTDLWAFGCVLYEALTGRQAFGGETSSDVLAAILRNEPEWQHLPSSTPEAWHRLLRRCLTKDPRERLRDAGDARLELTDMTDAAQPKRRGPLMPWIVAASALSVAIFLWAFSARDMLEPASPVRFKIQLPETERLPVSRGSSLLDISPDGKRIVYAAQSDETTQLYLRGFDELVPCIRKR